MIRATSAGSLPPPIWQTAVCCAQPPTGCGYTAEDGSVLQTIDLPGYGWAQCCPDVDQRYALAANIWNGLAARVDLQTGELLQTIDSGFTAPFRSLAGIAVFTG